MITLKDFDRESIDSILRGHGDWFSACLLRLIYADNDPKRAPVWAEYFPEHARAVATYALSVPLDNQPLMGQWDFRDSIWWMFAKGHGEYRQQLAQAFPAEYRDWVKWTSSPSGSEADTLFLKHAIR